MTVSFEVEGSQWGCNERLWLKVWASSTTVVLQATGREGEKGDSIQIGTSKQNVRTNPLYRPKVPQAAKMKEIRKWVIIRDNQLRRLESDGDLGSI